MYLKITEEGGQVIGPRQDNVGGGAIADIKAIIGKVICYVSKLNTFNRII